MHFYNKKRKMYFFMISKFSKRNNNCSCPRNYIYIEYIYAKQYVLGKSYACVKIKILNIC